MRGKIIFFENLLALYDNTDLLVNKVNGKWTIRVSSAAFRERERERKRERYISGYDDGKGHGRLGVRSMPVPIIVS